MSKIEPVSDEVMASLRAFIINAQGISEKGKKALLYLLGLSGKLSRSVIMKFVTDPDGIGHDAANGIHDMEHRGQRLSEYRREHQLPMFFMGSTSIGSAEISIIEVSMRDGDVSVFYGGIEPLQLVKTETILATPLE